MVGVKAAPPPWLEQLATEKAEYDLANMSNYISKQVFALRSEYEKEGLLGADRRADYLNLVLERGMAPVIAAKETRRSMLDKQLANLMITMNAAPRIGSESLLLKS